MGELSIGFAAWGLVAGAAIGGGVVWSVRRPVERTAVENGAGLGAVVFAVLFGVGGTPAWWLTLAVLAGAGVAMAKGLRGTHLVAFVSGLAVAMSGLVPWIGIEGGYDDRYSITYWQSTGLRIYVLGEDLPVSFLVFLGAIVWVSMAWRRQTKGVIWMAGQALAVEMFIIVDWQTDDGVNDITFMTWGFWVAVLGTLATVAAWRMTSEAAVSRVPLATIRTAPIAVDLIQTGGAPVPRTIAEYRAYAESSDSPPLLLTFDAFAAPADRPAHFYVMSWPLGTVQVFPDFLVFLTRDRTRSGGGMIALSYGQRCVAVIMDMVKLDVLLEVRDFFIRKLRGWRGQRSLDEERGEKGWRRAVTSTNSFVLPFNSVEEVDVGRVFAWGAYMRFQVAPDRCYILCENYWEGSWSQSRRFFFGGTWQPEFVAFLQARLGMSNTTLEVSPDRLETDAVVARQG